MLVVFRRWLFRTFPGRILLAGVAIKIVTAVAVAVAPASMRVLDLIDALGGLALVFVACYGAARGIIWAKRRLLWRVRRKLILSYIFVGLVPGLLIIAFFLLAGLMLFFNVSSYLVRSRVRTLVDQGQFLAQTVVLEAEREAPALANRLTERQRKTAERFPFTSVAIVPLKGLKCDGVTERRAANPPALRIGPWQHLDPPATLPPWIRCDGFAGLLAYAEGPFDSGPHHLVLRAAAVPQVPQPEWAAVVDLPFTTAIEERLRDETGIQLGEIAAVPIDGGRVTLPQGRPLESRVVPADDGNSFGEGWVAFLDYHDWMTGATGSATVALRLNIAQIYDRLSAISANPQFSRILLFFLAFIGMLFLIIQFVALMIGLVLARQITGAVHDLFTGTTHLRNRDFTHQIPVRARDQLGELAESFNVMTGEVTKLLRENANKVRMEQEMLAAREIQQKLLPAGPLDVPGLASMAFCEPAREVAGDYYDFLHISDTELGILIADVSGKGLPAGLYMAQLKVVVQSLARVHRSPRDFLIAVNRVVADNIDSKSFITMSYGVINLEKQEMAFARAGHCPLIHVPGHAPPGMRNASVLTPDGLVVGLKIDDGHQLFESTLEEVIIPLERDDLLVFFTDGISETMNAQFDCYGEARLAKVLEQYSHLPLAQLRSFILADLRSFSGQTDQHDDMTMIMLKVTPRKRGSAEADV
jgi:sigma-B regulation protein RsbU (phosphoserine phosphatase)